jgi:hypothetical protein
MLTFIGEFMVSLAFADDRPILHKRLIKLTRPACSNTRPLPSEGKSPTCSFTIRIPRKRRPQHIDQHNACRRTAIDWAGMTKPGGRCFIGSPVKSANPNRSAVAERRPATVYAASDDCTRSGQTAISSRYPSRRCCPGATLTAKFATRRAQTQEIPSEPGTSCILFKQLPKRGLPKPPKRNGSKGAVRPVFTYIFPSHDRAIALARDARAVIVVGLEKRVPLVLKARVERSG